MKLITILSYCGIVFLAIIIGSCDKTKPYELITPAPAVHFVGDQTQSYTLDDSTVGPVHYYDWNNRRFLKRQNGYLQCNFEDRRGSG